MPWIKCWKNWIKRKNQESTDNKKREKLNDQLQDYCGQYGLILVDGGRKEMIHSHHTVLVDGGRKEMIHSHHTV